MSNIVEYIVRMKDLMTGSLNRLSSRSQNTFQQMARHTDRVTGRNRVLSQSFEQIQRNIRNVENTIRTSTIPSQISAARRELERLQRQSSQHSGNINSNSSSGSIGVGGVALGSMIGGFALNAASAFLGAVKDGIGAAISGVMEKEKGIVGLSTFIGDKEANQAYANIRKDAESSSYDTATLLKANRALVSVDGNAKNAREDVMNLANAISATGGGTDELQRMAINMQQIKSLGKASAADIKQFGYAGINIYSLLAKATGKNADEVKGMDVTYDLLAKSLAMARMEGGLYAGALEKMNSTMSGKWESLKDRTGNALTDIGEAFSPVIYKVLDLGIALTEKVAPFLERIKPQIQEVSNFLNRTIESAKSFFSWITGSSTSINVLTVAVGGLMAAYLAYSAVLKVQAIWTGIVTIAQNLLNIALMLNPIGLVIAGVAALVAVFIIAYKKFDTFRALVDGTWEALKTLGNNIKNIFLKIPEMVIDSFSRVPLAIKNAFQGVGDLFSAIFSGNFEKIPEILKKLGKNLIDANPVASLGISLNQELYKGVGDSFAQGAKKSLAESKKQNELEKSKPQKTKENYFSDLTRFKDIKPAGEDEKEKNKKKSKEKGDIIGGGGTKYITINLGKFFENIQFTTMNMKESEQDIERILMECMGRVLFNGSKNM